jgi:hypothetical protein
MQSTDFRIVKITRDDGRVRYLIERFYPSLALQAAMAGVSGYGWVWNGEYKRLRRAQ